jgi:hypothetical protein
MKIAKSFKKMIFLVLSLSALTTHSVYAETLISPPNIQQLENQETGFPEKLKTFLELPGKKDFFEIPMQESYYLYQFVSKLGSDTDYGDKLRESFIEMTPIKAGVVKAKMKTTGRSLDISIRDLDTGYYYSYYIGNGYITRTTLLIPMDEENQLKYEKFDYLQKKFDNYLISQGYTNTTSMLGKLFNSDPSYEKDNIVVEIHTYGLLNKDFTITASKREIQDNIKEIIQDSNKHDVSIEYKNLDKILDTK